MKKHYPTQFLIDKTLVQIKEGFARCKICEQQIFIEETIAVAYWRHQNNQLHQEMLMQFYLENQGQLMQMNEQNVQIPSAQSQFYVQEKSANQLVENLVQSTSQRNEIKPQERQTNNSDNEEIFEENSENYQRENLSKYDIKEKKLIKKLKLNESESAQQKYQGKIPKKPQQKIQNIQQEKVSKKSLEKNLEKTIDKFQLLDKYFKDFILGLLKDNWAIEGICFLLGRLGKSMKDICQSTIQCTTQDLKNLIAKKENTTLEILAKKSLIILQAFQKEKDGNQSLFDEGPISEKKLRQSLKKVRDNGLQQAKDQEWEYFISLLKINVLNSIFMIEKKNKRSDLCSNLLKQQVKSEDQPEYIEVKDSDEENKYGKSKKQFSLTLTQVCQEQESISIAKADPSQKQQQSGKTDEKPQENPNEKPDEKPDENQVFVEKLSEKSQRLIENQENLKQLKTSKQQQQKQKPKELRQEQLETFLQKKAISEVSKLLENQSEKQLSEIEKFNSQTAQKMTENQKDNIQID